MAWVCPTFQRPDRLMELAETWNETATGIPLLVRIWSGDPKKEEYYKKDWPPEFSFYESDAEWAGETLHEYFEQNPGEPYYGFIGDDILLRTIGGIDTLIQEAGEWFIAYPNDQLQRHRLCTHFCIGGDLVREVGFLVPPGMRHHYIDNIWMEIGMNTGLLRYRPDILFAHNHFLRNEKVAFDETYQRVYNEDGTMKEDAEAFGKTQFDMWRAHRAQHDIVTVRRKLLELCEGVVVSDAEIAAAKEQAQSGQRRILL